MARETDAIAAVKRELDQRGWSQLDLAKKLGESPQLVSRWLLRERRPGLDKAAAIERVLGVPMRLWARKA